MAVRAVLVVLSALAACASPPAPTALPGDGPRIAVLPFRVGGVLTADGRFVASEQEFPEEAEVGADFARVLAARLAERGLPVLAPEITATLAGAGPYDAAAAADVARRPGADLAALGAVSRYRQRVGSAWGIRDPASVAYDAALVRVADGALLRVDRFDYTQRALTENLLDLPRFIAARGRWLTREEIRDGALDATAKRFAAMARGAASR